MFISRIGYIQEYLKENDIDCYISFLSDDHGSEYVYKKYQSIAFLSNFTGSAGTLLITKNASYLWTDGRYFLQAKNELLKSNTILKKIGIDETIQEFILNNINSIVLDFKVTNVDFIDSITKSSKTIKLYDDENLLNEIWPNRPKLSKRRIILLPQRICKYSAYQKCLKTLNQCVKGQEKCSVLICALDDIAYLLNARGFDIPCNPVFYSFLLLNKIDKQTQFILYIDNSKLSIDVKESLQKQNIIIKNYNHIYKDLKNINHPIFYDKTKTNYKLYSLMKIKRHKVLWPSLSKAIKTSLEIKENEIAHIKDGIAMVKFLYYFKNNISKKSFDEIILAKHLEKIRKKCGAFELSFKTICAYKEHGAIVHYNANEITNKKIVDDGFLLLDSGGQYYYGTTDITRTIALKNISSEMKYHYTLVLKAHIALATAIFTKDTTDKDLDYLTRKVLWDNHLDYNHGTGHGVGFMLNVHEGPQSIRYNKQKPVKIKKSMITSDEPGLYFENKYGIRHENELLCIKIDKTHLGFKPITYVPFDLEGIDVQMLTDLEINWLNNYHKMVYEKINSYLNKNERKFLLSKTREIKK